MIDDNKIKSLLINNLAMTMIAVEIIKLRNAIGINEQSVFKAGRQP